MTTAGQVVVVRAVAPPAPEELAGPVTYDGDLTIDSPGTSLLFGQTVDAPMIRQSAWTGTGPDDGHRLTIRAQDGRNVTSGANRAGGSIGLEPGAGGTGGTGDGAPGGVEIGAENEVATTGLLRTKHPGMAPLLASRNESGDADIPIIGVDGDHGPVFGSGDFDTAIHGGVITIAGGQISIRCTIGDTEAIAIGDLALGFFGTPATAQPTVSGSRGANAALASLLTALAGLGLIVDSSS